MKIILFTIFWIFNPIVTPDGIQIGEISINNQKKIKIMKGFILSPEWLQSGSNVGGGLKNAIVLRFQDGNDSFGVDNVTSDITVTFKKNGTEQTMSFDAGYSGYITPSADPNTDIICVGNIGSLYGLEKYETLTSLSSLTLFKADSLDEILFPQLSVPYLERIDLTGAPNMTSFDGAEFPNVTFIDVSKNKHLADMTHISCPVLNELRAVATNRVIADAIAYILSTSDVVDGVVYLNRGDEYNQTIIDAAMEKGWDVQYAE